MLYLYAYCVHFDFTSFQNGCYTQQSRNFSTCLHCEDFAPTLASLLIIRSTAASLQEKLIIFVTRTHKHISLPYTKLRCRWICCLIRNFGNIYMHRHIQYCSINTILTLSDLMIPFRINKLFQLDKLALAYFSESILCTHTLAKKVEYVSQPPQVYWALEI